MARKVDVNNIDTYYFSDTSFNLLMQNRIRRVLVICSSYDFFMLEEDGRIDEHIFNEYVSLNLRYPPVFVHADSAKKAFSILDSGDRIDLIIEMLSIGDFDTFELAKQLKGKYSSIPIVILTHFSREVSLKLENEDLSAIDYVFCWLGNADLLLAIIKLIEDRRNADFDIQQVGVQAILIVEDSIRFASSFLPNLYQIVLQQSMELMKEALNEHQKMLRRRGRPKVILAQNYDEAVSVYEKYKKNILGIISDISFKKTTDRKGPKFQGGIEFCRLVRAEDKNIPFLLQSSDVSYEKYAQELGVGFLYKHSKNLSNEVKDYIIRNFGFGDFIFRHPKTLEPVAVAADLKELQQLIMKIPDEVLVYHGQHDDISKWLNARALFPIASIFKPIQSEDFKCIDDLRKYIYKAISSFRTSKAIGTIAEFDKHVYDEYLKFSRIGGGSLGGKARGLAFFNSVIQQEKLYEKFRDVVISIPRTVVLSTEVFEEFMESNDLYKVGMSGQTDEEILAGFIKGKLPDYTCDDLEAILTHAVNPIAVRSSSKLEDSYYQPFAGIYNTYMIPVTKNKTLSLKLLETAIKSVYASVYFKTSKAYVSATSNIMDEEKMGIILQEVCGNRYGNHFYPTLAGVARSINFYPISPEKPQDGIANVAFGLGKLIVDGEASLRFSPRYPTKILQLSNPEMALRETQKSFFALDMNPESFIPSPDDRINLVKLKINEADAHGTLRYVSSVYDFDNHIIRDTFDYPGKKIITFSNILQYNSFPLAEILDTLLQLGQKAMNNPIEIEFAANLDTPKGEPKIFNFLQIRPIVINDQSINFKIDKVNPDDIILYSEKAMGNGVYNSISNIIYIKPDAYNPAHNKLIAAEIEKLNETLSAGQQNYILIGPGRWGSADPWLGIPIKWAQISAARVIVESGLEHYRIDPSQGTHFFHNLTTFGVGYLTINPYINDGLYSIEFLAAQPAAYESEHIRHIAFQQPIKVEIDGKSNKAVVYKPGRE
ncbi:MAG: phosphoenolpyruvate synthase [Bacteroidales bacterium]|nr:phosphoenolpyruvate synthase [Bacteroidales bacterium]MBN2763697.1 phosphoenolpyruvate synthase [Bacteroidales bacterium]